MTGAGVSVCRDGQSWIISDSELLAEPQAGMFRPEHWQGRIVGRAPGRGEALFIEDAGRQWVLRHYRRGGLPGRLLRDSYLYLGLERSRPFREWRVLAQAFAAGVPVPRPVAAALHRRGLAYTADIILERIDDAVSLAEMLARQAMTARSWAALAEAVAATHAAGYWHADLNARNVICRQGQWWLIDFDRARRRAGTHWREGNLARLRRSLDKLQAAGELRYAADDWDAFVSAYREQLA